MRKFGLLGTSALRSAVLFGFAMSTPAFAQVVQEQDPPETLEGEVEIESGQDTDDPNAGVEPLVVTGSRIRRPNLESNVPVTSVSAEELTSQGDVSVGDALNDLPSIRSTFSQANSARFIGTTGLNILDLRGLGTARTLVLVNGRRHITSAPGDFDVDINTIPTDLIERVDVITGGSSAVYGSDAVAGVVNFVLKRNYEGIALRGQSSISDKGDRAQQFVSVTAGQNFADDRGNIAVNLEYVNSEALFLTDRPGRTGAFAGRNQFNVAENTGGEPASGDGVPDNQFFRGVRNAGISDGGTVTAPIAAATCRSTTLTGTALINQRNLCSSPGTAQGQPRFFNFAPDGGLIEQFPSLDFRPFGSGNIITPSNQIAPGSTLVNKGVIAPSLDRYTANLLASFEVSEAFRPFVEAKYVHIRSVEEGQPSFFQGTFPGFFGAGRGVRCDNPFLTSQNIAALQSIGRCAGGATSADTIPLGRFSVDFGGRSDLAERDTYRIVAGIQGDFNDDWNYELAFNYGKVDVEVQARNDLQIFELDGATEGPFLKAVDAVRNAQGQIVCRVNADANPANDDPACIPVNLFGQGRNSQAAIDYINTTSVLTSRASQYNVVGFVGGDLSQLFELPGGPVRFAVGGEYRRESAFQEADPLSAAGATFFNAFPVFDPPALEVYEAFGEVEVPILKNLPFAEELTVSAAARYSDYDSAADKTFSYNINGTYAPSRDIRFRANYSKSVRVPTLSDLFTPPTQNFAFVADPCDFRRIGEGGPNRLANCRALGVPVGFEAVVTNSQTAEIQSSGNPFLEEETGKSLTLGVVFTPRFIPGLSVTVDYYKIELEDRIETLGAQVILNQCVDLPNIDNQFCQLIFPRQTVDDPGTPVNEVGALASPALVSGGINFARGEADGVDIDIAYRKRFANDVRLDIRGIATRVIKRNNFVSPTDPEFNNRQLSEFGDPKWAANLTTTLGIGPVDVRYTLNYIGPQIVPGFAYESFFPLQGRPATNADALANPFLDDVLYHALRLSYKVSDRFTFYGGVDNIFDKEVAELGGNLGLGGGDPFDPVGRYMYIGATVSLGGISDLLGRR